MKKLLSGTLVAFGLTIPGMAIAADLGAPPVYKAPPAIAPVYSWTGFYIGANAGYGWNQNDGSAFCVNPVGAFNGPGCDSIPGSQIDSKGFIGGGQIGYNWQVSPNWLLGLEADFQGSDIKGSLNFPGPIPIIPSGAIAGTYAASEDIDWFGTVRARAGLTFDRVLVYGTGGLAYGKVDVSQALVFPAESYSSSASVTKTGWTAGGGIEWAFANNWSARLEYLYYDLGTVTSSATGAPTNTGFLVGKDFDVRGSIARAAINYKFDWGAPVVSRY